MKVFLVFALLAIASAPAFAQAPAASTDAAANSQANRRPPAPVAPTDRVMVVPAEDMDKSAAVKRLFAGGSFSVNEIYRKTGDTEGALIHKFTSEVYVIQAGSATLLSGGTLIGPVTGAPDQQAGKGIEGGTTQQVKAGDVVFIPAGVAHVFSAYAPDIK
jgi:mannose-6-phosphate isomerase-like protein (cupin superfamily)